MNAKRLFDIFFSALGLVILLPILLVISAAILFESGRSIIFRQERVGLGWKPFMLYKFRTMNGPGTSIYAGCTARDDYRVTRAGRFLRKYKFDELPQLFNVLKGDMSLVGPRPELAKFAQHYREKYDRILEVRPGITDLAAIQYRNEYVLLNGASSRELEHFYVNEILPKKLEYSLEYLKERSFFYDLQLIFQTISIVIFK